MCVVVSFAAMGLGVVISQMWGDCVQAVQLYVYHSRIATIYLYMYAEPWDYAYVNGGNSICECRESVRTIFFFKKGEGDAAANCGAAQP